MTAPDSAEGTSDVPVDDVAPVAVIDDETAADAAPDGDSDAAVASDAAAAGNDAWSDDAGDEASDDADDVARWTDADTPATALTWVDVAAVGTRRSTATLEHGDGSESGAALLKGARLRPAIAGPGVLVPFGIILGLVASYAGTTMLWPLHEVAPTVEAVEFAPTPAPVAELTWPVQGSAAVGVGGIGAAASSLDAATIASVTKVVSSLMVLDRMPLAVGEQGPEFSFTRADSQSYWQYRRSDQSALDVPVGGTLTEYQLLQGTLLGSANNYIDRLASEIWGSNAEFAAAAAVWLRDRGLDGITIVTPSGFDAGNIATPDALVKLAERAMQNPVFASIVGTVSVDLPGAGTVVNTNGMLADAGVVGVKTGTLGESWNLLTAKDITVDDMTVRLYAAVLGQGDNEQRLAETRSLFLQVETALQEQAPAVVKGTVIGEVTTMWGATVDVITDADAHVVLWNGSIPQVAQEFSLGERREAGDEVGTITSTGPLNSTITALALADDIEGPSPWWRLTHPLELFGLTEAQR